MHGAHFLNEEYQISVSRLSNKPKQHPSKDYDRHEIKHLHPKVQVVKYVLKIVFALFCLIKFLLGSIRTSNILKFSFATQIIASYITPKLLVFKRSFVLNKTDVSSASSSSVSRIIEISPPPLHLIIAFSGLDEAKKIMKKDSAAQLITPINNISSVYDSIILKKMHLDPNATTIFESLAFSWCESYKKNKIYPTKLIVTGPAKISSCVMGRYRWALKIPKEIISFRNVNGTDHSPNFLDCSKDPKDPFDCGAKGRESIRSKYSEICPDMAPILLACNNRFTLEKALAYKPKWSVKKKSK